MIFVTVNFNTTLLTACWIGSIKRIYPESTVIVLDNSTYEPFPYTHFTDITYLNNTAEQLVSFSKVLSEYSLDPVCEKNNYASLKHCLTIEWLLYNIPYESIVLMDSDTLLKQELPEFNHELLTIGTLNADDIANKKMMPRIYPYCQFFNLSYIRQLNIHYFHPGFIMGICEHARSYDTGAYFYSQCVQYNAVSTDFDLNAYILHYKGGSWKPHQSVELWEFTNRSLWRYKNENNRQS